METLQDKIAGLLDEQFSRAELDRMIAEFSIEDWKQVVGKTVAYDETPENNW